MNDFEQTKTGIESIKFHNKKVKTNFKKLWIKKILKIIDELWEEILKIDENKNPKLKSWNINYFTEHKNRYVEDLKKIQKIYKGGKIIEIGSLPCHVTFLLKKLHLPIIGIDLNPKRCSPFINEHNLKILKCDIEQESLPFKNESVNLIIFNETFEHLRINPIKVLHELHRILSPEGRMMLTTPNLYSLRNIVLFNLGKGTTNPFKEFNKLETVGHMGHIREYSSKEMQEFLNNTGFKIIETEFKAYKKSTKLFFGFFINLIHLFFKKIRPFQIIIV